MSVFAIEIKGLKEMQLAFEKSPLEVGKILERATIKAGEVVRTMAMREAPRGQTGKLRDYMKSDYKPIQVRIYPGVDYAIYVHEGTRAHFPPVSAVSRWAVSHGINPWALAVSMAKKGTKANPFFERTIQEAKRSGRVQDVYDEALGEIINLLATYE